MNRKLISTFLITATLTTIFPCQGVLALDSNANGIIIPYIQDNGVDAINITDLAKAMRVEVKKVYGGIEMFLNNKRVDIYDSDTCIYVNGSTVPLKVLEYKDAENGKTVKMPMAQKPTKSGDGYLIPKTVIQDSIGIDCSSDGIHINDISVPSASSVDNSASYNRSSTSTATDGWKTENGVWHYYKNGTKATGWIQDNSKWYYLGTDGSMKVGWVQDGGNWYYLNSDGSMACNTTINGYYLGSNGAWTTDTSTTASGEVTGISYSELLNRVESLGFGRKQYFSAEYSYGDLGAGYGFLWKESSYGNISIYDNGAFNVDLSKNGTEFNRAVHQIFVWLLPTQADNLQNILSSTPKAQTLTMDGRTVTIKLYQSSISVTISG